jgi:hypothetical protein
MKHQRTDLKALKFLLVCMQLKTWRSLTEVVPHILAHSFQSASTNIVPASGSHTFIIHDLNCKNLLCLIILILHGVSAYQC